MTTSIRGLIEMLRRTTIAAGLGTVMLLGGTARAATVGERAEAAMNMGLDSTSAWQAATRALGPGYSPELASKHQAAEAAQNAGEDYVASWEAGDRPSGAGFPEEQVAKAQAVQAALGGGEDYAAAWEGADEPRAGTNATR